MVPVHKTSKSKKLKRRSHHRLRETQTALCPNCNSFKLPHARCTNCGYVRPGLTINLEKKDD